MRHLSNINEAKDLVTKEYVDMHPRYEAIEEIEPPEVVEDFATKEWARQTFTEPSDFKTINGQSIVGEGNIETGGEGGGNEEGTEVLTLFAMAIMWDLSPSMFEIPDGEELPEEQIELMEILLAMLANNVSVYNKIMSSDASAKSYSVVINYMMDYINGMACRTIVPAVLIKSFDSFRIIPSEEYVSYTAPIELPDLGYTISEDGGYSRKSAMIMFAIKDTGVIPESLVQQNARVAKLLINKKVNISNIYIFFETSSLFNALAEEIPFPMSIIQTLMEYAARYYSSLGSIMSVKLDSWGNVGGSTNEIYFSIPGAIAKFDPYSSSPTITEVVDFTKINN